MIGSYVSGDLTGADFPLDVSGNLNVRGTLDVSGNTYGRGADAEIIAIDTTTFTDGAIVPFTGTLRTGYHMYVAEVAVVLDQSSAPANAAQPGWVRFLFQDLSGNDIKGIPFLAPQVAITSTVLRQRNACILGFDSATGGQVYIPCYNYTLAGTCTFSVTLLGGLW
jgi:hypothetical protein